MFLHLVWNLPLKALPKWCVSVCFCNGLCHGNVSMVTRQRRKYSSMPLSGEYLRSFCLVGNDDNSAECWIKLKWGRLTPSYCRKRKRRSSSFAKSFAGFLFCFLFVFVCFLLCFFFTSFPSYHPTVCSIFIAFTFIIFIECIVHQQTR